MHKDLEDIGGGEEKWYAAARAFREGWRAAYRLDMESYRDAQTKEAFVSAEDVVCEVCSRTFRRVGDKKRHKCVS